MDTLLIGLVIYFTTWVALGSLCSLRCKRKEEARLIFTPLMLIIKIAREIRWLKPVEGSVKALMYTSLGIVFLVYSLIEFYNITISSIVKRILEPAKAIAPFAPIVPGVTISIETFLYLLPGLSIAVIVHELSHALAAKAERIPIKSAGFVVFLAFVFGAFVEISEDVLRKTKLITRLRIYSAGVAANTILALILLFCVLTPLASSGTAVIVISVEEDSLAEKAGIMPGSILLEINGKPISTVKEAVRELSGYAEKVSPNYTYKLVLSNGVTRYAVTITKPPSVKIGIIITELPKALLSVLSPLAAYSLYQILLLAFMVNYALAVINAAPLFITDGAKALDAILERFGRRGLTASRLIQVLSLILLLANINIQGILR